MKVGLSPRMMHYFLRYGYEFLSHAECQNGGRFCWAAQVLDQEIILLYSMPPVAFNSVITFRKLVLWTLYLSRHFSIDGHSLPV